MVFLFYTMSNLRNHPIGIFDSGYGGLSVFKAIAAKLPDYDYIYLGDNARSPYGTRSYEVVYKYTLQAVKKLFKMNCKMIILACNTASAKALRTIQQNDLPKIDPSHRVLGVLRPSVEITDHFSNTKKVGIFGTEGTVNSESYPIEIHKIFPEIATYQQPCPMWVPLVEHNEHNSEGADFFVKKYVAGLLGQHKNIDAIILGCTHYPFLIPKIKKHLPKNIKLIAQDSIVADSLKDYLSRHPEMETTCSKNQNQRFYTTGSVAMFDKRGSQFLGRKIQSEKVEL